MLKGYTLIFFLFFDCLFAYSQSQNSIWCFGDSAGIDFRNSSSPQPIISGMDGRGSCVGISDSIGNLLFYAFTNDCCGDWSTKINNKLNLPMQGVNSITGSGWYNELTIIPKPGSNNLFYIFSCGLDTPNNQGFFVTTIDMNLDNGNGAVISQNIQLHNFTSADCIQSIKHGNGRDWWVISKYSSSSGTSFNRFIKYLVTPNGILPPVVQDFNNVIDLNIQRLVFSPNGTKLMEITYTGFLCEYDFDRCTGVISNPHIIYPDQTSNLSRFFWEGAYSPNGNLFYVTTVAPMVFDTSYLMQFDLTATNIPLSSDTLEAWNSITNNRIGSGAVRLAPDGKIYFSRAYQCDAIPQCFPYPDSARSLVNYNLSVINNPNGVGSSCNYQPFSFSLGGKRTYYGLPNNPDYQLGPVIGSVCDSLFLSTQNNYANNSQMSLSVFPNPSTGIFSFQFNDRKARIQNIKITDITGHIVMSIIPTNLYEINLSHISPGIYFYSLTISNGELFNGKLIKN